jgi:hypothetical protein
MQHVRRQESMRLCTAVAPAALSLPTTALTTSSSWRGRQRESKRRNGQSRTPRGMVAIAQMGVDASAVLRAGVSGGRGPDGGGSLDRRGRAGDWVDEDHCLYRRYGSPSPDRYHGHHGIQAVIRDVGPDVGWPTLTKTNYIEWAAVMRVRLQVRQMWEAVRYDGIDYYED